MKEHRVARIILVAEERTTRAAAVAYLRGRGLDVLEAAGLEEAHWLSTRVRVDMTVARPEPARVGAVEAAGPPTPAERRPREVFLVPNLEDLDSVARAVEAALEGAVRTGAA